MMKKATVIFIIVLFVQLHGIAQMQRVEIAGSQVQRITSSINNQEYELQIFLPSGYENSQKKYPVLYLMDSQWDFPLVTSIYGEQYYDGFIPEVIIVGVTWGGTHPNPDSLRAKDYTTTNHKSIPQSGGAPQFLNFLKKELIPFIESRYKANSQDRSLMGCSFGGLFTLFALFTEPELFQRYIATTPAIGWNYNVIYQYEKNYFEKKPITPARLFMTMGEVERGLPEFEQFSKHLASRNYPSLYFKTRIFENTGHSGNKAEGYARGLQYVFERPSLQLNPELLTKYAGRYRINNSKIIEIKNEGGRLALYVDPGNKYILHAASETDFYATSEFLKIKFTKDKERVNGFQLERFDGKQFITRLQ
ncbi:alpha/beta hydrolase-fold protein [Chitinophagaceae bacterium LB-8]|uniref:Alpha/beta hydrolase-fold protein n=1 Tax=Paraflavisolibacter caeni TaxID=2982496 RepID=A0A9X2XVU9_9BACT|nr:alpha/beta hydrolase-fold protein [Paraflavisolibacter caeni]MCU7550151.1 alpha/beta hydrolase-fold protein [Paraflavisolibacter caeni]